jgi:hypothetical protein
MILDPLTQAGHVTHLQLVAFLNSVLIEEFLNAHASASGHGHRRPLDPLLKKAAIQCRGIDESDEVFETNLTSIQSALGLNIKKANSQQVAKALQDLRRALPLFSYFITCPILVLYLRTGFHDGHSLAYELCERFSRADPQGVWPRLALSFSHIGSLELATTPNLDIWNLYPLLDLLAVQPKR